MNVGESGSMSYHRTVVVGTGGCHGAACLGFGVRLGTTSTILFFEHIEDFRLVTVRHQVVRGVDVLLTFLVVFPPLLVDELVSVLNFFWEDGHPVLEFLGIGGLIFREVKVNKAGKSMSVCSESNISSFVGHAIDDLFLQPSPFIPITNILFLICFYCVFVQDALSFLFIELLDCLLLLLLDLVLVLLLKLSDFCIMLLLECKVFLHHTVHVRLIHIHVNHFLSFFKCLVLIL